MIMPVGISRLDETMNLIKAVVKKLSDEGIDQWDDVYPARADIETDIKCGSAFGYFLNNMITGYIVVNDETDPEYDEAEWKYRAGKALIIHRLSVHPDFTGRGFASALVDFAEIQAAELGYTLMRLDAFSLNPAALCLYEKKGYRRAGEVNFRKGKFFLYEKRLQDI